MSAKANSALIGAFVIGAAVLLTAAVLVLGTGQLLEERPKFVLYFPGSVQGLNTGAPVVFRGVKVGTVQGIRIEFDEEEVSFRIPVTIELDPERVNLVDGVSGDSLGTDGREFVDRLVAKGLRAQLQVQSLVTGQLLIQLDMLPDKKPRIAQVKTQHPQIPTIPSKIEEISRTIESIPLGDVIDQALAALEVIERVINSPELARSIRGVDETLQDVRKLVRSMDQRLATTDKAMQETLADTRTLLRDLDQEVGPLAQSLRETSETGQRTFAVATGAMENLEAMLGDNSEVRYRLLQTLEEAGAAARSLRSLTDYLERNPGALLRGRSEGE